MKTHKYIYLVVALLVLALAPLAWADKGGIPAWAGKGVTPDWAGKGNGSILTSLNEDEVAALSFMREEEKLARDVYLVMIGYWGADTSTFANIAVSEQKHMDTMKKKLDKYGLPDSASLYEGVFNNPDLQEKYNELIAAGHDSLIEGLIVGATIEDLDIRDIQAAIDVTIHIDLVVSYQNLMEGSKNHLRAFVNALAILGYDYEPQYISQELFDAIMDL